MTNPKTIAAIVAECREEQARYADTSEDANVGCMNTGSSVAISEVYRRLADALEALEEEKRRGKV